MKIPFLISAALFFAAPVAHAQNTAPQDPSKIGCRYLNSGSTAPAKDNPGALFVGTCMGSIRAVLQLHDALVDQLKFCRPEGKDLMDATKIVVQYMDENPKEAAEDNLTTSIIVALNLAWPCKGSQ